MSGGSSGLSRGSLDLPDEITRVRITHPWELVASRAKTRLSDLVPELSEHVESLDTRVFGRESGFFYLPAAQAESWGVTQPSWLEDLLTLLAIGHAHFAVQDMVVDSGGCPPESALLADVCLLEYLDALDRLSSHSPRRYRDLHDSYYRWYLRGLLTELGHRQKLHAYSVQEISELGLKAAPGNTIIHLVADASGRPEDAGSAVKAVMQLCTGLQLLDDLNDISGDYGDGNLTMALTATLLSIDDLLRQGLDPEDLVALAASSGVAVGCVGIAQEYFSLAEASAVEAGADVIAGLARMWSLRAESRRRIIAEALAGL